MNHSINDLLVRYQQADASAFDEFYRQTEEALFSFLLLKLRNRADAEDCLHDAYIKIHAGIMSYDPSQNGMTWIFTIARNAAIDRIRKNIRQRLNTDVDINTISTPESDSTDLQHEIMAILKQLSAEDRDLIERKFLAGDSYENIAAAMESTPASLRQRVSRIIRKLKQRAGHA